MSLDSRLGTLLLAVALLVSVWLVVRVAGPPQAPPPAVDAELAPPAGTTSAAVIVQAESEQGRDELAQFVA